MAKNILCDIVLLPDSNIKDITIAESKRLAKRDSYFTLGKKICVPHISLYMLQLKTEDLVRAESILSRIAHRVRSLLLEAYRPYQNEGYVDIEYRRFDLLDSLQMEVVHNLSPIRNGMYIDEIERMKTARGIQLENLQKYGYQNIGELFRPHLTLTRLKTDREVFRVHDVAKFSGIFPRLGMFELGDHGTCVREIKTFDFLHKF